MTHWQAAGYGIDPEGDARRRDELSSARVDPDRLAVLGGYGLPAARAQAAEREAREELSELYPDRVSPDPDPEVGEVELHTPGHAVTRTDYGASVAIVCECGRWECIVTGPSSAAWAGRDYRRHVDAETASDA